MGLSSLAAPGHRKVLHVLGLMNRGGAETWLMHLARRADRMGVRFDFLVHSYKSGDYDSELQQLGCRIIHCPLGRNPFAYGLRLKRTLETDGPYDVVHSHVHHFSGLVLWIASLARVPVRIAHSHTDSRVAEAGSGMLRRAYLHLTERLVKKHATQGIAVSEAAAESLFGSRWKLDGRNKVIHCGIDLEPFLHSPDQDTKRQALAIPGGSRVIGHVGRFDKVKNHRLFLEVAAEVVKMMPEAYFVLVGDGVLRSEIQEMVSAAGLSSRFSFLGIRPEVPEILLTCIDVFLFPSIVEGLPLALLEAQAAGIPCVISDTISKEADALPELIRRVPLESPARDWAASVVEMMGSVNFADGAAAKAMQQTDFNIETNLAALTRVYRDQVGLGERDAS